MVEILVKIEKEKIDSYNTDLWNLVLLLKLANQDLIYSTKKYYLLKNEREKLLKLIPKEVKEIKDKLGISKVTLMLENEEIPFNDNELKRIISEI